MPRTFRCGYGLPIWAAACCAVALTAPPPVTFLTTVLAIGVIASTMPALVRRFGQLGGDVGVLPTLENCTSLGAIRVPADSRRRSEPMSAHTGADDAGDMARMDDDGGWQTTGRRLL
jgi:hypothetical protein